MQLTNEQYSVGIRDSDNNESVVIDQNNNVYAAYYRYENFDTWQVFFRWYNMRLGVWSTPIEIDGPSTEALFPAAVVVPENEYHPEQVWFAWMDQRYGTWGEIWYRVWDTETRSWAEGFESDAQSLSELGGLEVRNNPSSDGIRLLSSEDGRSVHAFWVYFDPSNGYVMYSRHFLDGEWGSEELVSDTDVWTRYPSAAYDKNGNIVLVYDQWDYINETRHLISKSYDGDKWSDGIELYELHDSASFEGCPSIATDNQGLVHLAFNSFLYFGTLQNVPSVYYTTYDEGWGDIELLTSGDYWASFPSLEISISGDIWVFWEDGRDISPYFPEIYFRKKDSQGWGSETRLTSNSAKSSKPTVVKDLEDNMYVFWNDSRVNPVQGFYNIYDMGIPSAAESLSVTPVGQYSNPLLSWNPSSSMDVTGYKIYRSGSLIGSVNACSTSFVDGDVAINPSGQTYTYTVKAIDAAQNLSSASNAVTINGIMMKTFTGVPDSYELIGNFPNPFNPSTEIRFALPKADAVRLRIYNIHGQLVATIHEGPLEAGYHSAIWNGKNQQGRMVSSGLYFYRLETSSFNTIKKMTLLK